MNFIDTTEKADIRIIRIISADYLQDFTIHIIFNDGTEKIVNLEPFLRKSQHPGIRKYLNLEYFKGFKIVNGNLNWNDYDMIFHLEDLYKGEI